MKAVVGCLVTLCLLAGFISADLYAFQPGQTYTYRASGRLLAGISEINTQYAGFEYLYDVEVVPVGSNRLFLLPKDFKISEVNEEQDGGWRDVPELKGETVVEIPQQILQFLESPVEVKLNKGVVESIKVQRDLPNYALNIKRAQVSHFVLDSAGQNAVMTGNMNRETPNHVRPEDPTTKSGMFYKTMEETVLGNCETYYTVSESGPYENPRTDPLKAELANDENDNDSQERQGESQERRRQQGSSSSEESGEQLQHSKYMAYKDMIRRSGSSEETGTLAPEVFHNFCEGKHLLMEFTKTVNYSMCEKKPVLGYASPSLIVNGRAGDNSFGNALARVTYSRFIACGKDRKQLIILKIEQEEQYYQGILRKEKTVGGSIQNLTLIHVTPTKRIPIGPTYTIEITDLTYTFSPREQKMRRDGKLRTAFEIEDNNSNESAQKKDSAEENYRRQRRDAQYSAESAEQQEMDKGQYAYQYSASETIEGEQGHLKMPSMTQPPLNPMLASPLNAEGMKNRVGKLLEEIVKDILDDKPMAEEETVSKIATMSKILRYLPYVDVEILYNRYADKQQTEEDQVRRKIFLESVAAAGTNPNMKLLIDLITKQRIVGEEANQLIMTFPMYIRTPTTELIHYFFNKLVEFSPSPDNMDQQHTTAYLAFTNLVHDACVNTKIAYTRYPVQIYGEFCNPTVTGQYVQHIANQLKWALEQMNHDEHSVGASHWATVFLTSLGNTGHPAIVDQVQWVLDNVSDSFIKTKAVFALKRLLISRSSQNVPISQPMAADRKNRDPLTDEVIEKKVLPILAAVVFDKTEAQEVRMAAVSLFVRATPTDSALWQQLAYSTWFELNQEVHSYIFHIIRTLSNLKGPIDPIAWNAHKKARAVLPLVKPIELGLTRSRVHTEADYFPEIQSGYMHEWSQFGSENSAYPNAFYYQNFKFFGGNAIVENPIEFSAHGHTLSHIVSHLIGKFQRQSQSVVEGNEDIKIIADLLHIVDREQDETPQASFRIKLRSEMERIFSVNREVIDIWIEKLKKEYIPALITGIPINVQKVWKLAETNYEFPTIFGIPVQMKLKTNNLISIRGSVKVAKDQAKKNLQVNLELHPVFSYKTHGQISFKSPVTGKAYQSGVQKHVVAEFPFRAMFQKSELGFIEIAITPTHLKESPSVGGEIDVFTFHRRPYTAIITDECWPASHKEGGQMKIVHAIETPYKEEKEFGQKTLGLAFEWKEETEYQPEQEKYPGWSRFIRRFTGTYGGLWHKGVFGAKTLRLSERKLTLDVAKSKTKTLWFIFAGKFLYNHHHIVSEVSSEENRLESSEETTNANSKENTDRIRQVYDSRSGDFESRMDKKLKQRPYNEYRQYKAKRYQTSEEKDSSEESSEKDYHGEFYAGKPESYRASFEEADEAETQQGNEPRSRHMRWFVIALLGKTTPLHPPMKIRGIQDHHENAASAVQYLFSSNAQPGWALLRVSAGEATKEHALMLPWNSAAVKHIQEAINSPLTKDQKPMCGHYEGVYEFPHWANRESLLTLRENLLREDLKVELYGEFAFGNSCHNKQYNVTFIGKLARDNEMLEYAKEGSDEAKQCAEDEKKGFASSPVCIVNSEQQAAALNYAAFEFRSSRLPAHVYNATVQVREFVKAWLYEYMSYDPMPIRPMAQQRIIDEYLRVEAKLTPEIDYLTLKFFTPKEQVFFEDIKLSHFAKAVFPITATQTLKQNIRDRVFKTESSCSVEGKFVNTFDNVTYEFDPEAATNCKHVLFQDCSGNKAVSVLADNLGSSKLITTVLLPGHYRIELLPMLRQNQGREDQVRAYVTATTNNVVIPGQGRVLVNGEPVKELPVTVYDKLGHFIARVEEAAGASLQLFADDVKVISDGRHIVVYPSNMLRNHTCGLCGNFDVSKTIDFRSPRDCPLSTGNYLSASYAIDRVWKTEGESNNNVCKIAEDVKKAIEREERDCKGEEFVPVYAYGNCKDQLVAKVGDAVYDIVRTALKPIPGVNGKKWAEKARNQVRELLKGAVNANDIAEIVASGISKLIPYVGGIVKPLIKVAVKKIVEVICNKSGCCDAVWYF